jgi:hypothetical protein
MLNHIPINNGWAEDVDYGDRNYDEELQDAAAFAKRHDLGVWELRGGFGQPLPEEPTPTDVPPTEQPAQEPAAPEPETTQPGAPVQPDAASGCDPNYTPCIPAYPPDLDCGEIGISVTVTGGDPHGLDRDNDGLGCEAN